MTEKTKYQLFSSPQKIEIKSNIFQDIWSLWFEILERKCDIYKIICTIFSPFLFSPHNEYIAHYWTFQSMQKLTKYNTNIC